MSSLQGKRYAGRRWLPGICLLLVSQWLLAAEPAWLTVHAAFIDMHTGPGEGYPVLRVIERGQRLRVLDRHTLWYRITDEQGHRGWIARPVLLQVLRANGVDAGLTQLDQQAFVDRRWEAGASGGRMKGAPLISLFGAYAFNPNLSAELTLEQAIGTVSSSLLIRAGLLMQPFPDWDYSPFFTLGAGHISVRPNATLIKPLDRNNSLAVAGLGFKTWLARRFVLRFEVDEVVIFSASRDQDNNEEMTEWKLGFAVFF